jgi:CRP-like cAMP-binding protein
MSRQIGEVPIRVFGPGDVIFREGDDPKGEAFMVHIGRVEIRQQISGEDRLLRVLATGGLLGELGLFGNAPRSATAVATTAVTLMVISANRLDHLVRSNPSLAVAIIRDLTTKLLAAESRFRKEPVRLICHEPQDREGARPDDPAVAPAAGGSGDRVTEVRPAADQPPTDDARRAALMFATLGFAALPRVPADMRRCSKGSADSLRRSRTEAATLSLSWLR